MYVNVTGIERFKHTVKAAEAKLKGQLNEEYRKLTKRILIDLALNTPQWSGDLAASWRAVISSESGASRASFDTLTTYKAKPDPNNGNRTYVRPAPHFKGDREAADYVLLNNEETLSSLRYNMKVTIINTNPTAEIIANPWAEEEWLRPGNFIPGDVMAVSYVSAKYSRKDMRIVGDWS